MWRRKPTLPRERMTLLRPAEVAVRLGLSQAEVWQLTSDGFLAPAVRTLGGHARFSPGDVEAFAARRT